MGAYILHFLHFEVLHSQKDIVACQAHPALRFLPMLVLVSSYVYWCHGRFPLTGLSSAGLPEIPCPNNGDPILLAGDNITPAIILEGI